MRLLLDTHTLIWLLNDLRRIPQNIRQIVANPRNEVFVSAVSIFEIANRGPGARKQAFDADAETAMTLVRSASYTFLSLAPEHAAAIEGLATFHPDPFDRLLLAQAQVEGLQLVTHDKRLAQYDSRTILF